MSCPGRDADGAEDRVGLVTFAGGVQTEIAPQPVETSKFAIADAIVRMKARGTTALYTAIKRGVELTDPGLSAMRTRPASVVVLSDGEARAGADLDDIVSMITSGDEVDLRSYSGMKGAVPVDVDGKQRSLEDVERQELLLHADHDVQVFFLGFGEAATCTSAAFWPKRRVPSTKASRTRIWPPSSRSSAGYF